MAGELAEAQATSVELSAERDELAGSLANLEAEHANLLDAHSSLKCAETLELCTRPSAALTLCYNLPLYKKVGNRK